jgi:hypothetical protein
MASLPVHTPLAPYPLPAAITQSITLLTPEPMLSVSPPKPLSLLTWRPRELSRGNGVLELLAYTVSAQSQPKLALRTLPKAVRSATVLKGVRGEADDVIEAILARVV